MEAAECEEPQRLFLFCMTLELLSQLFLRSNRYTLGCEIESWDNNLAENEIRPVTLGRKNYLFCGNHEAAQNMAVVCSLLATCRNHDVNPRDYLNDIISQMPYHTKASYEELLQLLPHKWKLTHPESVMTKTT